MPWIELKVYGQLQTFNIDNIVWFQRNLDNSTAINLKTSDGEIYIGAVRENKHESALETIQIFIQNSLSGRK